MNRLFVISAMFVLTIGFLTAQDRISTADFNKIEISNAFNVLLVPSDRNEIVFPKNFEFPEIQPNMFTLHKELTAKDLVSVKGNTLTIGYLEIHQNLYFRRRNENIRRISKHEIVIYFKSLNALNLSGASLAKSEETIKGENTFRLRLSKGSRAELDVIASTIDIKLSGGSAVKLSAMADKITSTTGGASNLYLTGRIDEHRFTASGGSKIDAEKLRTQESEIRLSGGSRANVKAVNARVSAGGGSNARIDAEKVTGTASGGSRLRLSRNAQQNVSLSGGSSIRTL